MAPHDTTQTSPPLYVLHFDRLGTETGVTRHIEAAPADLAREIHRHARGILGSNSVDIELHDLAGTVRRAGRPVGTFTLIPDEPAAEPAPPPHGGIRYGYTMRDLDALARSVVSNNRTWWPAGDRDDLHAAAWHGIVEHLYTADHPPRRTELMEAGRVALAADVKATMRHRGDRRDTRNNGARYAMYWEWAGRAVPSPEAGIVDRLALEQILPALTAGQRAAIEALAAAGDYDQAARLVGSATGLKSQLMKGRRRFRELWHEGEVPSAHWGCDRRAGSTRGTVGKGESAVANLRRRQRAAQKRLSQPLLSEGS